MNSQDLQEAPFFQGCPEREGERGREGEREGERDFLCMCVCVCVCLCVGCQYSLTRCNAVKM